MAKISCEKPIDFRGNFTYKKGIPYWIEVIGLEKPAFLKYHKVIVRKLQDAKIKRELHDISKRTGIIATRLSEFQQNKRIVNEKYIIQFVRGGIISVNDLIKTWNGSESPQEKEFILALRIFEKPDLLTVLVKIEELGLTEKAVRILRTLTEDK